jgi:phosphotransferase system enzyme I (PtsI)
MSTKGFMSVLKLKEPREIVLQGVAASPGIAIGKAFVLTGEQVKVDPRIIGDDEVPVEMEKLMAAIERAKQDLQTDRTNAANKLGREKARIFEAHQMLLEDEMLINEARELIKDKHLSADSAFYEVVQKYQDHFGSKVAETFRDRVADLRDVKRRVVRHIQGVRRDFLNQMEGSAIIIARDMTPTDTITLDRHKILGFATDMGGKTSHASLVARSYEVPAVVGLREVVKQVKSGERVILDGSAGTAIIHPSASTLKKYRKRQIQQHEISKKLDTLRDLPARSLDGKDIELAANLEFTDEIDSVVAHGARGIGLFRTEYLYLKTPVLPTEDEQFAVYREIAQRMRPYPVIIRTMDLGGDKAPQSINIPPEDNPFLGWRAIRISLEMQEVFLAQLRAMLRASAFGNVKILLPMISGIGELKECLEIIDRAKEQLRRKNQDFSDATEVGVMVEVPSAGVVADLIAERVDFLSLGTNDLVQYLLAVDRGNERIAHLYQNLHPAVLRTVHDVIQKAHQKGVWVGMCGEMAADPLATILLIGMEIDELSVSPIAVPEIKRIIRAVDFQEASSIMRKVMEMSNAADIEHFMMRYMRRKFKDMVF